MSTDGCDLRRTGMDEARRETTSKGNALGRNDRKRIATDVKSAEVHGDDRLRNGWEMKRSATETRSEAPICKGNASGRNDKKRIATEWR